MWMLIIGIFIGVFIGMLITSLCVIASEERLPKDSSSGVPVSQSSGGFSQDEKTIRDN